MNRMFAGRHRPGRGFLALLVVSAGLLLFAGGCSSTGGGVGQGNVDLLPSEGGKSSLAGARPILTSPSLDSELRIRSILERWKEAQGGSRRLDRLRSIHAQMQINELGQQHVISTAMTSKGFYRYELVGAEEFICGGYDGVETWQNRGPWGASLQPGNTVVTYWGAPCIQASRIEQIFPLRNLLPDETVGGSVCSVIRFRSGDGRDEMWYFDQSTNDLLRVKRQTGPGQQIMISYADYRFFNRLRLPCEIKVNEPDGKQIVYKVIGPELNAIGKNTSYSAPPALKVILEAMDGLLKQSAQTGYGDITTGRPSITHARLMSPTTGMENTLKIYRRKPGYVLVENDSPALGRTVSGFDGKTGWENSEILGYHALTANELSELFSLSWLGCDPFLRERFSARLYLGETQVEGRAALQLRLLNNAGLSGIFTFDKENARLLRVETDENPSAKIQATKVEYADYREVDSLVIPFRVTYRTGGVETVIICEKVELDAEMPDTLFSPRTETD